MSTQHVPQELRDALHERCWTCGKPWAECACTPEQIAQEPLQPKRPDPAPVIAPAACNIHERGVWRNGVGGGHFYLCGCVWGGTNGSPPIWNRGVVKDERPPKTKIEQQFEDRLTDALGNLKDAGDELQKAIALTNNNQRHSDQLHGLVAIVRGAMDVIEGIER